MQQPLMNKATPLSFEAYRKKHGLSVNAALRRLGESVLDSGGAREHDRPEIQQVADDNAVPHNKEHT
jgi:hypothetical protein